jgi:hypothetical protein
MGMLFLTVFFVLGLWTDGRSVLGQPAWLKPAKFGVSTALYALTLTWLLGFVRTSRPMLRRIINVFGWVVTVVFMLEMVLIAFQAARGTASHFNFSTPFDQAVYSIMGVSIMVLFIANLVLAAILVFVRFDSRSFGWSVRLGLIIAIIGMGEGFLMTSPTAQQLAAWEAGAPVTVVGAHAVGVADGGPGMPVTGWSSSGGDLRAGHFVGMHALQVLPFVGWLVSRRRQLRERQRVGLVVLAAASYLGFTVLLVWQALRAQPLIAPDALTVVAFLALALGTALAAALISRPAREEQVAD